MIGCETRMGSSDLAGWSAFDEVLAMGSTWPFLGDPTVASGGRQRTAPGGFDHQGPDAPSAHRRPGYPLSGCVPAEPDSVSPGNLRVTSIAQRDKPPSDTGVMPPKIHHIEPRYTPRPANRFAQERGERMVYNPLRPAGQMARCSVPGDTIHYDPLTPGCQSMETKRSSTPSRAGAW